MKRQLRAMILEDNPADAELIQYELCNAGYDLDWWQVDNEADFVSSLDRKPDVILADFALPTFDAVRALRLVRKAGLDIPFIIISGVIEEQFAVTVLKEGAADYLLKDRLTRLGSAVDHALEERQLRLEQRRSEARLRDQEKRFRALVEHSRDGIALLATDATIRYASPGLSRMLGYEGGEVEGLTAHDLLPPEAHCRLDQMLSELLEGPETTMTVELHYEDPVGGSRWLEVIASDLLHQPEVNALVVNFRDITARRHAEEQLSRNAFFDTLTGLPNRALFIDRLGRAIARARRHEEHVYAVLFLDLDRFKNVNDSLGHVAGDELLIGAARRLESCLRPGDTVARLGGDEFTILLEEIRDVEGAIHAAERIQSQLSRPFELDGREVFTSVSIGIALGSPQDSPEALLRDADIAMYRAKARGRTCHEVFDTEMHAHAQAVLQLETDLRRAAERLEFRVFYQPIIALGTGEITGFEALVRWFHPERGFVSPVEFIPIAEDLGLIGPIGHWILYEACRQLRAWHLRFPGKSSLTMSVNLSARQFSQPNLIEQILDVLRQTGLDPHSLKLEITESALFENPESATARLLQLRALGIQLCMDDFGTGYSSLNYLHRFPMEVLKIDRSFIGRLDVDGGGTEIVRAIVTLARSLRMQVTAEGVETEAQLSTLRALGCDYGQGYLFSRPIEARRAEMLVGEEWEQWKEAFPAAFGSISTPISLCTATACPYTPSPTA